MAGNNYIDSNGIHTETISEIVADITQDYKNIYGDDINTDSNTPDGQRINIEAQAKADMLEFAKDVYSAFDVDEVGGRPQDSLYKLNNVFRKNSGFSFCEVNVTVSQPVNLEGLDTDAENPEGKGFTVSDINGNNWILLNSVSLTSAGTYTLEFRAEDEGEILASTNTINTLVTVIAGIVSVNNPASQYITGNNAESDADFRIRRAKSTAISGKGFYDSLLADLLDIPLVQQAAVYEHSDAPDIVPESAIWVIVQGGTNVNIGAAIYRNHTFGCQMIGQTQVPVLKTNGKYFTAKFDRPQSQPLYIKLTIKSKSDTYTPDVLYIKRQLVEQLVFELATPTDITQVSAKTIAIDSNVYVLDCQLSLDNETWANIVSPTALNNFFGLTVENIDITVQQDT